MRNLHFTASSHFFVTPAWTDDVHSRVRKILTQSLYTLFQTNVNSRTLEYATTSERRALVAFRHWYLRMRRSEIRHPYVYINVNTGRSLVVIPDYNPKNLLIDPRFFEWELLPLGRDLTSRLCEEKDPL